MRESTRSPVVYADRIRFLPADWVVVAIGMARLAVSRGKYGKLGVAAVLWSLTPRKLKLFAAGLVAAWLIIVLGAMAALALLALQLT